MIIKLDKSIVNRITRCAMQLADFVLMHAVENDRPYSLSRGCAGDALFLAYAGRAFSRPTYEIMAKRCIWRALTAVETRPVPGGLLSGLIGIIFAALEVGRITGDIVIESELEEINLVVKSHLQEVGSQDGFDLISGSAGYLLYGALLGQSTHAAEIRRLALGHLQGRAVEGGGGLTWRTSATEIQNVQIRRAHPDGVHDLGVAHGVPGVMASLAYALLANPGSFDGSGTLSSAVSWLLAQGNVSSPGWRFGSFAECERVGRLAWCYGDLGVSRAVYLSGAALNSTCLMKEAENIAVRCCGLSRQRAGVQDAGLCHGAAGVMHIFHLWYQDTGRPIFADEAMTWAKLALEYVERSLLETAPSAKIDIGFLEGIAGTGLALLELVNTTDLGWDAPLLLRGPRLSY